MSSHNQNEISSEDMAIQDVNSEYLGIPRYLLMENAGSQIASYCRSLITKKNAKIAIFCGTGGNGGDGFVAARHLHDSYQIDVFISGSATKIKSKPAQKNFSALKTLKSIKITEITDSEDVQQISFDSYDLILDGLLGTGLEHSTIRQPLKAILESINSHVSEKRLVVSIDIPSGLKKDGLPASIIIKPTHTVALHKPKLGTYEYGGKVHIAPIGIPLESAVYTGPGLFTLYPKRKESSHKGQNGKILIIGASNNYHGSAILAGKAAFSLNIDLVYMVAPEKVVPVLRNHDYRFIIKPYQGDYLTPAIIDPLVKPMIQDVDVVLIGPGLGTASETMTAIKMLFKEIPPDKTLVIDADGLKACKGEKLPADTIVTPHAGEFTILTGKKLDPKSPIDARVKDIEEAIKQYNENVTWVVKGPVDVIMRNNQKILNYTGTPSMTTGGTGDTLAGLITAIRSVVKDSFLAGAMGTFLLGKAGEFADKGIFTLQTLLDNIPIVLNEIQKFITEEDSLLDKKD